MRFQLLSLLVAGAIAVGAGKGFAAEPVELVHDGWVGGLAFGPDGETLIAACSDKHIYIWDLSSPEGRPQAKELAGHGDYVVSVAASRDGRLLASGSYDQTARLWASNGETRHVLTGHRGVVMSVAFSPDGSLLASGGIDRTVRLWDAATGKPQAVLTGHRSWVNQVAFSPDGKTLASASSDGTLRLWDVASQKLRQSVAATPAEVRSLAWSPDGRRLAAGLRYGQIKVWDASLTEQTAIDGHRGDVWSVAFLADSRSLASGDGDWNQPGEVKVWNAADGKLLSELPHSGEVLSLAVSPDGKKLAAGSHDRRVRVWEME